MKIEIITNSCFLIKGEKETILVDPYISKKRLKELNYDYVLISHPHIDHALHLRAISKPVIGTRSLLLKETDICIDGGYFRTKEFKITTTPTCHPHFLQKFSLDSFIHSFVISRKLFYNVTSYGFVIKTDDNTLYYSGDTSYRMDIFEDVKERFAPDICLVSFGPHDIPGMNLLSPMNRYKDVKKIFQVPVIPIHFGRKWYERNLDRYIDGIEIISLSVK